jgi:hypothetical protein
MLHGRATGLDAGTEATATVCVLLLLPQPATASVERRQPTRRDLTLALPQPSDVGVPAKRPQATGRHVSPARCRGVRARLTRRWEQAETEVFHTTSFFICALQQRNALKIL